MCGLFGSDDSSDDGCSAHHFDDGIPLRAWDIVDRGTGDSLSVRREYAYQCLHDGCSHEKFKYELVGTVLETELTALAVDEGSGEDGDDDG